MKRTALLLCSFILFSAFACAAEVNTTGKLFLFPVGARSLAMGGCGTLLGEAYGGLYNPAAQALSSDLSASVYANPYPYFVLGHDFVAITASSHNEFGYIGFSYLSRKGINDTDYPPEEATAFVIAGKPSRKVNLSIGIGFKILATRSVHFVPLNQSTTKTHKMAFDFGVTYHSLLPQLAFSQKRMFTPENPIGRKSDFLRGLSFGIAFQNIGGKVEFENEIYIEMLPQLFRADILWGVVERRHWNLYAAGEVQKLLVKLNESSGYTGATEAFFQGWGSSEREGTWTSRLGFELNILQYFSSRIGWAVDDNPRRAFTTAGFGMGLKWLRFNTAWEHEPGSDCPLSRELRYGLTANLSYEQLRGWMGNY